MAGATFNLTLTKATGSPLLINGTGVFTANTSNVIYAGATSNGVATTTYYNLTIGTAGTLTGNATTTNDLTVNSTKSLDLATYNLYASGNLANSGTITQTSGTVTATGTTKTLGGTGFTTLYNLTVDGTNSLVGNVTTTNILTISTARTLSAGGYTVRLTKASGQPMVINGTFTANTSTVIYAGTSAVVATGTYYNLTLNANGTFSGNVTSSNSFTNNGALTIPAAFYLSAAGTYDNNGTTTETGFIKHPLTSSKLTNSSGTEVASYNTGSDSVYITVEDSDGNLDATAVDTVTTTIVTANTYSDSETIILTETGVDTSIFRSGALTFSVTSAKTNDSGVFEVSGPGTLTLAFTDSKDASDTGSDTASYTGSSYVGNSGGSTGAAGSGFAASTPAVTTPVAVVTPVVATPAAAAVTGAIEVSNLDSAVAITPPTMASYQPGAALKFTYVYKNETSKTVQVRIARQLLDSKGKVVKSSTTNKTLKKGVSFTGKINEAMPRNLKPGLYTERVRILDLKGKVLADNSFKVEMEKLKKKYFTLNIETSVADIAFDTAALKKVKSNVALPSSLKLKYSYTNNTGVKHDVRMVRELVNSAGKVISTAKGKWVMAVGEKDSANFTQSIGKLAAGDYTIRIRAYDFKSNELLAENSVGFTVELK